MSYNQTQFVLLISVSNMLCTLANRFVYESGWIRQVFPQANSKNCVHGSELCFIASRIHTATSKNNIKKKWPVTNSHVGNLPLCTWVSYCNMGFKIFNPLTNHFVLKMILSEAWWISFYFNHFVCKINATTSRCKPFNVISKYSTYSRAK